ncbi:4-hydroxy-2-oxoheptanedioate aldolase [Altererythrobacter atlanticus]|uniref:4-hydroxy-2-oxovalerate aldolase n=1 Tax=Croceibacterium atlanticum TaxID=1267766 RepID=A0A0F7KUH6_9SPHN|nr:4-hydroxy-2-oxoheptanedioate aldolase [Croceibacterium atlanticum]AKH42892.1 4-hydroxy-2-oxovalerate aldolase [Croceibacterium atlanticum]MBB5731672.1 4-hydroxy-2-oxoheptanedioate aldolase [Croceibacterium atlanticum]
MNAFKRAIAALQPQIGIWQALATPYTAEICAGAGFDWMVIDAEHGPNDLPLVMAQLQAVDGGATEAVVRLPVADTVLVKQYLDIGARSLLIPMIDTAEGAAEMVRATRYPPFGIRGVGAAIGRASRWDRTADYLHRAQEDICLLLQVESQAALENLEAIAETDGVDGVFIGPSDLAADLGHLGNPAHPDVQAAIETAIARISACGKPSGILIADERLARHYLELGASFVAVGTDVSILARGTEALAAKFKSDEQAKPSSGAEPKPSVY